MIILLGILGYVMAIGGSYVGVNAILKYEAANDKNAAKLDGLTGVVLMSSVFWPLVWAFIIGAYAVAIIVQIFANPQKKKE